MKKRTKIVCTIGPASEDKQTLSEMVEAGMNVARLNFSHGTYESHKELMDNIREVSEKKDEPVAIMQDVQGPKIRLGDLPEGGVELKQGDIVILDTSLSEYKDNKLPVDYGDLHEYLKKGERLMIDDGKIIGEIKSVNGTEIRIEIEAGGTVSSNKGINAPDSKLAVRAITEKDKKDIKFGVKHDVDLLAVSFVRTAEDILDAKYLIQEYEEELNKEREQPIRIIAKIERQAAVENIEEIMDVVDGIMVARGDLGIEIPAEEVPLQQKELIDRAIKSAKPVIVATQMLDSMQENPRPTRAEVSDVSNAVIDHTDAVMLSGESATGKYPVKTVETMTEIIQEAEESHYDDLPPPEIKDKILETEEALTGLSRIISEELSAKLILAASMSGDTARLISRYRPELPITVGTNNKRVQRQLNLSWGVVPFILPECKTIEELVERSTLQLKRRNMVKSGDKIIVVAGEPVGQPGQINLLEVKEID